VAHAAALVCPRGDSKSALWWEICLLDRNGHVLDGRASTIGWRAGVKWFDGTPLEAGELHERALKRLKRLREQVRIWATYTVDRPYTLSLPPEPFVERRLFHARTRLPAYMHWRAQSYLAAVNRALRFIERVRRQPLPGGYTVQVNWRSGAVALGARGSISMLIHHMANRFDYFSIPWALAHELLHGFRYGHNPDMDMTDREVQRRFSEFRWWAEDNPAYYPRDWNSL